MTQSDIQRGYIDVPAAVAAQFLLSMDRPFVLPTELVRQAPRDFVPEVPSPILVAPMRWEPDGFGTITVYAEHTHSVFSERDIALAQGIADITSLALGNAQRFVELQLPPGGELGDLIWQDSDALNLCGGGSETEPGKQAGAPDEVSLPELQQHNAHQDKTQRNSERKTQAMRKVSGNRRGRKNSCGNGFCP